MVDPQNSRFMINERLALVMLEGEIPSSQEPDPNYTKRFYHSMQTFAHASFRLCEAGRIGKFEDHLKVALRLFREGNETVKNGIINVYLYTIARTLDQNRMREDLASRLFPRQLMNEYNRLHYVSGM
jgi:hypothetical protein